MVFHSLFANCFVRCSMEAIMSLREATPLLFNIWVFFVCAELSGGANCALYRWYKKESWISGVSHCEVCGHKLTLLEVLPVISYLALRGRCFWCGANIGYKHAIVEAFVGLSGAILFSTLLDGCNGVVRVLLFSEILVLGAYYINLDVKKGM